MGDDAAKVSQSLLQLHLLGVVLPVLQLIAQFVQVFLPGGAVERHAAGSAWVGKVARRRDARAEVCRLNLETKRLKKSDAGAGVGAGIEIDFKHITNMSATPSSDGSTDYGL